MQICSSTAKLHVFLFSQKDFLLNYKYFVPLPPSETLDYHDNLKFYFELS